MEDYAINIYVKQNSNNPNDTAEMVNFHFSHYKSMETISCQSNQSSYPTGIKKITKTKVWPARFPIIDLPEMPVRACGSIQR